MLRQTTVKGLLFLALAAGLLVADTSVAARGSSQAIARGMVSEFDDDPEERVPLAVPEPSALAIQYNRTGDVLWVFAQVWGLAVPLALLVTGASARLRDLARRIGRVWLLTVGFYVVRGDQIARAREYWVERRSEPTDRKSTRLNSSHHTTSRMPSSA